MTREVKVPGTWVLSKRFRLHRHVRSYLEIRENDKHSSSYSGFALFTLCHWKKVDYFYLVGEKERWALVWPGCPERAGRTLSGARRTHVGLLSAQQWCWLKKWVWRHWSSCHTTCCCPVSSCSGYKHWGAWRGTRWLPNKHLPRVPFFHTPIRCLFFGILISESIGAIITGVPYMHEVLLNGVWV